MMTQGVEGLESASVRLPSAKTLVVAFAARIRPRARPRGDTRA